LSPCHKGRGEKGRVRSSATDKIAVTCFLPAQSRHKPCARPSHQPAESSDRPLSHAPPQTGRSPIVRQLSARFGGPRTPALPCPKRRLPHFPCSLHAAALR